MKHLLTTLVLLLFLTASGIRQGCAESFTAMAPPYPPYSVSQGLKVTGMSVETLTTIMAMCDAPIDEKEIKLTPWAYAYENAASGPKRIMLNAQRTLKTEHLYKWVGPFATSRTVLIGKKKNKFFIQSKKDLEQYRIATVRWSRPEKTLLAEGVPATALLRSPTHVQALRWLDNDEIDLFAFTQRGAPCLMQGLGMRQNDYTVYFTFREEPLYFAFSRDTNDNLIARLNRALKEFKG